MHARLLPLTGLSGSATPAGCAARGEVAWSPEPEETGPFASAPANPRASHTFLRGACFCGLKFNALLKYLTILGHKKARSVRGKGKFLRFQGQQGLCLFHYFHLSFSLCPIQLFPPPDIRAHSPLLGNLPPLCPHTSSFSCLLVAYSGNQPGHRGQLLWSPRDTQR